MGIVEIQAIESLMSERSLLQRYDLLKNGNPKSYNAFKHELYECELHDYFMRILKYPEYNLRKIHPESEVKHLLIKYFGYKQDNFIGNHHELL